jgi:hypothetical protein
VLNHLLDFVFLLILQEFLEPLCGELWSPFLCFVIHIVQSKPDSVSKEPLKIVNQRPDEIATNISSTPRIEITLCIMLTRTT